jgi:hypothetical protein
MRGGTDIDIDALIGLLRSSRAHARYRREQDQKVRELLSKTEELIQQSRRLLGQERDPERLGSQQDSD